MTAKELREYAAWLKNRNLSAESAEGGEYIFKKQIALCDYILATVQEDGEGEPTPSWIEENFPVSESGNGFYRIGGLYFTYSGASWHCCRHRTTQSVICPITTRSQFRSLMTGLGIEPQKISEKR